MMSSVLNKPDDIIAYDLRNRPYNDGQCNYFYLLPGPRINTSYLGIPALDVFGFARSAAYNPAYYDPSIQYQPWLRIVNEDRKSTRLNSSHSQISYAVFCLKKKKKSTLYAYLMLT